MNELYFLPSFWKPQQVCTLFTTVKSDVGYGPPLKLPAHSNRSESAQKLVLLHNISMTLWHRNSFRTDGSLHSQWILSQRGLIFNYYWIQSCQLHTEQILGFWATLSTGVLVHVILCKYYDKDAIKILHRFSWDIHFNAICELKDVICILTGFSYCVHLYRIASARSCFKI